MAKRKYAGRDIICYRSKFWEFYPKCSDNWLLFPEDKFADIVYQWKSSHISVDGMLEELGYVVMLITTLYHGPLDESSNDAMVGIHIYSSDDQRILFRMRVIDEGHRILTSNGQLFINVGGTTGIRLEFERGAIVNNPNPLTFEATGRKLTVDSQLDWDRIQKIDVCDKLMPITISSDKIRPDIWKFGHLLVAMVMKEDERYSRLIQSKSPELHIVCNIEYMVIHTKPTETLMINVVIVGKYHKYASFGVMDKHRNSSFGTMGQYCNGVEVLAKFAGAFDANCEYLVRYDSVHRTFGINRAELVEKLNNGEIGPNALKKRGKPKFKSDVSINPTHMNKRGPSNRHLHIGIDATKIEINGAEINAESGYTVTIKM